MSTATLSHEATGVEVKNVVPVTSDVVVGTITKTVKNKQTGAEEQIVTASVFSADSVDAKDKDGNPTFHVDYPTFKELFRQTVSVPQPQNYAGAQELFGENEAEFARLLYRGILQKATNRMNAKLTDVDEEGNLTFEPIGVFDLTEEVISAAKRQVLTERQKMEKSLRSISSLSEPQIQNMLRQFDAEVASARS